MTGFDLRTYDVVAGRLETLQPVLRVVRVRPPERRQAAG
jgi:hypothetical protein